MKGEDYASEAEFIKAYQRGPFSLDIGPSLSRVYRVADMTSIAQDVGRKDATLAGRLDEAREGKRGRAAGYAMAAALEMEVSTQDLARAIARHDHSAIFPLLTYRSIPAAWPFKDVAGCREYLKETQGWDAKGKFQRLFENAFEESPTREARLEHIAFDTSSQIASFVFGHTRIMRQPDARGGDYTKWAVVRVPIVARILFGHGLVEFALPNVAEPVTEAFGDEQQFPDRAFESMSSAIGAFSDIFPEEPKRIDASRVLDYMEQCRSAHDMGWYIVRPVPTHGANAEFDMKQPAVPLKLILDEFAEGIARECKRRKLENKLEGINLYKVFRALKATSHTVSMILEMKLGPADDEVRLTCFLGSQNDTNDAIFYVIGKFGANALKGLREAVALGCSLTLADPYALENQFPPKGK